jgi:hypothetical protein
MDPDFNTTMTAEGISPEVAAAGILIFGGLIIFILVIVLIIYIYMAICLMKIARKTNTEDAWFAWIPILNWILMLRIAQKPIWWIILFFVPIANIVVLILTWMGISEKVGKPNWLGVLMIVPIANLIIPGYLAFSDSEIPTSQQPPMQAPPVNPIQ